MVPVRQQSFTKSMDVIPRIFQQRLVLLAASLHAASGFSRYIQIGIHIYVVEKFGKTKRAISAWSSDGAAANQ